MQQFRLFGLVTLICAVSATPAVGDETKADPKADVNADAKADNKLVGTWKLVSAKYGGRTSTLPQDATTLKHITPTQYMWLSYGDDGVVTRGAGGTYTLEGDEFTQMGMYGVGPSFELVKGGNTYKCKVEGKMWRHTGSLANGLTIEEVWERIEK